MFRINDTKIICIFTMIMTMFFMSINIVAAAPNINFYKKFAKKSSSPYERTWITFLTPSLNGAELYCIEGIYGHDQFLYVIDAATGRTTKKIELPKHTGNIDTYGPNGMILSPDGKMIYILANTEIIKIDAINKQVLAVIPTGKNSTDLNFDITNDGLRIVAADYGVYRNNVEAYIHIIDTQKNILSDAIPKGSYPNRPYRYGFDNLVLDKLTDKVYLKDHMTDTIAILDLNTKRLEHNAIQLTSGDISAMMVDSLHGLLYLIELNKNILDIIDLKTKKIIDQVKSENDGKMADVALSPDGNTAYISSVRSNIVEVMDTKSHRIIRSFQTWDQPIEMRVSSDGKKLYIAIARLRGTDIWSEIEIIDTSTYKTINEFPVDVI